MPTAPQKNQALRERIARICPAVTLKHANTLRLAERTLQAWSEGECGNTNRFGLSWAIERDEVTGKPYRVTYPLSGKPQRSKIADREAGALKRIATLCKELGLYWFHQTDCRGCMLYVSTQPLNDQTYMNGIAIY